MAVVLVTGSSSGIGKETALMFARKGHNVYASCRNLEKTGDLKSVRSSEGITVNTIELDLTKPASIENAVARIVGEAGGIDVLIGNAAIGAGTSVEETTDETSRLVFETNYFGNVNLLKQIAGLMRKRGSGHIVMVSSNAYRLAAGCNAPYTASKWALEGLCECLAQEMAEFGIAVSLIEPGVVLTPLWQKIPASESISVYPNTSAKLAKFFDQGLKNPNITSSKEVATAIVNAVESKTWKFRIPVGSDALEIAAARSRLGDEAWVQFLCKSDWSGFCNRWNQI